MEVELKRFDCRLMTHGSLMGRGPLICPHLINTRRPQDGAPHRPAAQISHGFSIRGERKISLGRAKNEAQTHPLQFVSLRLGAAIAGCRRECVRWSLGRPIAHIHQHLSAGHRLPDLPLLPP